MTTDVSKLHLKDKLEEQKRCLEEYSSLDVVEYPGWTFLLSAVVKAYGICPYLDVKDLESKERRETWLLNQSDKGEQYFDSVKKLLDQGWISTVERELDELRSLIRGHVDKVIRELNEEVQNDLSEDPLAENDDNLIMVNHDELIDNIRMRKEAKSQNKKVKQTWNQTIRALDFLVNRKGLDFSKYIHAIYGYVVRYKPPLSASCQLDAEFESLYEKFNATVTQLNNCRLYFEKEKDEAEQQLVFLIKQNFQLDQVGRYYKKWSSLTQEKKEDRIKSYCDWYMRKNSRSISLADQMKKFIVDKLDSKELRIMDVKWDSKIGMITDVNVVLNEDDTFELGKRAPRILKSTRKTSKKKRDEMFQTDVEKLVMQRINRLLLFELVKGQTLNKDIIVKTVVKNLHTRLLPENQIVDYVSAKYDELLETIRQHPV